MMIEREHGTENIEYRKTILQKYYSRYLTEIRKASPSTVRHYIDALNNISRRLKEKGVVRENIYEIMNLNNLEEVRRALFADPEFIAQDSRGRRMYSAGLNNYYRFASGEGFTDNRSVERKDPMKLMDIPIIAGEPCIVSHVEWSRSNILREQVLSTAGYTCEIDRSHQSFIAEKTNKAYMEGHHAIPMRNQPQFENSLDVYANIICLCPVCHRRIHHGLKADRVHMMNMLYESRADRLANSGIRLSREEFAAYA